MTNINIQFIVTHGCMKNIMKNKNQLSTVRSQGNESNLQ